jgi:type IV secretory pathway TraG/TraD family ATPase VirD4
MTLSPKYGGYFILGAQSISQFEKNYGPVSTNILFDACSTKVYFRLPSVKTAKWASADIGEEELEEKRETMSISGNRKNGGSLSTNEQIRVRYPVSYTEIKNLEKLTAFLNLPGNWPVAKIKFKIFDKEPIAPAFIPAEVQPIKIIPIQVDEEVVDNIRERISQIQVEEMT